MQTTLTIPDEIADTIKTRVRPYRGSVPGYAAQLAEDFALMTPEDEAEVRAIIERKLKRHAAMSQRPDIGASPAVARR